MLTFAMTGYRAAYYFKLQRLRFITFSCFQHAEISKVNVTQ